MAGIKIDFLADVSKFLGKTKDVEKALEDVADALDDLGDEAKRSGDALGDGITKGAKEAESATEKLEGEFKRTIDKIKAHSRGAGDDLGDGVKRGAKKAEGALDEFKAEAGQTARESAASFGGEFTDVADAIQETLANALAGLGPMGAAAGVAAAIGVGALIGELERSAEKAEEARERMVGLADAIREAGGNLDRVDWAGQFSEFASAVGDAKEWFEVWQSSSRTNLELISDDAQRLGLNFKDVFRGLAGEPESLARALSEVDAALAAANERTKDLITGGMDPLAASMESGETELQAYRDKLVAAGESTQRATDYANQLTDAIGAQADAMLRASGSQLALDSAILDATETLAENGATLDTNTRAGIENRRALNDIAEAARSVTGTQEEVDAAMRKGREAFMKAAGAAGMGADEADRLARELFSLPPTTSVTVVARIQDPNISAFLSRLQSRINSNPLYVPSYAPAPVARASGGPVSKGKLYRVGEEGEELFVPDQDGQIIPADETRDIMRGPSTAQPTTSAVGGGGSITPEALSAAFRSALDGASVELRNGRLWFQSEMAAQRRSDLIEARAR